MKNKYNFRKEPFFSKYIETLKLKKTYVLDKKDYLIE